MIALAAAPLTAIALVVLAAWGVETRLVAGLAAAQVAVVTILLARAMRRQRDAEAAVARADTNLRILCDSAPDAIVVHRNGDIAYLNPSARRMFRPRGAATTLADLVVDPSVLPATSSGSVLTVERELAIVAGGAIPTEIAAGEVDLAGGAAVLLVIRDLSDRRQLRERLVTTDRLMSLGTLAAGVAHEINNPLTVVLWNLELLRDQLASSGTIDEARAMIAEAIDAGERVRSIVADMRTLSRSPGTRSGPVDLVRAIDRALQLAAGTLKHRARISREYQQVPKVIADEARLVQVVINLLTNAADAIPPERAGQGTITVGTRVDADGSVVAWVRDDGTGIPPEIRDRIFDPFFTTKEVGVGTGLGLSISHTLVTSMQGRLAVSSESGQGTTVSVTLRAADDAVRGTRNSEPPAVVRVRPRRRILIIDDEAAIGSVASRLLGRSHDVSAVTSGRAALARVEAGERFDLVLCDLLMPELTGLDVHARLRASAPDQAARVVFMTGGVGQESRDAAARLPAIVLEKPLNARTLSTFVDEYLAREERAA